MNLIPKSTLLQKTPADPYISSNWDYFYDIFRINEIFSVYYFWALSCHKVKKTLQKHWTLLIGYE